MFLQEEMTAEEFLAFAEQHPDKRFDFVDGELVEVSPKRLLGRVQTILAARFQNPGQETALIPHDL
jgi:Uma2 family endonuclease